MSSNGLDTREPLTDMEDLPHGERASLPSTHAVNLDEPLGIVERKRLQKKGVHEAEDRRVGADGKRQREYHRSGNARLVPELSKGHPEAVAEEIVGHIESVRF